MTTFKIPDEPYSYETIKEIADFLLKRVKEKPKIGIICGTGLGSLSTAIEDPIVIPYEDIPHFPKCTVSGHVGQLIFGKLSGASVMCMKGRFHIYEGYPPWIAAMPVRVMKLCGATHLIISNAAGGLNRSYKTGDIMIMKDHVNFVGMAGGNPLIGLNDERFGKRYPAMSQAYNRQIIRAAKNLWESHSDARLHEGVYVTLSGPNFETVAEMNMLLICGIDAVGMSTAHEVTYAIHCGMTVFGFTLITNMCVLDYDVDENVQQEHVLQVGQQRQKDVEDFVIKVVKYIDGMAKTE